MSKSVGVYSQSLRFSDDQPALYSSITTAVISLHDQGVKGVIRVSSVNVQGHKNTNSKLKSQNTGQSHIETLRTGPNERFGRWSIDALHGTGKCIQEPGKCILELEVGISNFHTSQQLRSSKKNGAENKIAANQLD